MKEEIVNWDDIQKMDLHSFNELKNRLEMDGHDTGRIHTGVNLSTGQFAVWNCQPRPVGVVEIYEL
jgi:hypothetical protein